jgi:hypothetical protein
VAIFRVNAFGEVTEALLVTGDELEMEMFQSPVFLHYVVPPIG